MIANKKEFYGGVLLMAAFLVVLVIMFSPVFKGQNGLDYLDALYNSISKGSAYYIPKVKESADEFFDNTISVELAFEEEKRVSQTVPLFMKADAMVNASGKTLTVSGDLGKILENALADADAMYKNQGDALLGKYEYDGKRVLLNWWVALHYLAKGLDKQKKFAEAKIVSTVNQKAVECCYNYYGIEAQGIGDKVGIVIFSLVFYVIYTMWYGFAIMYMFEGWGMQLEH
jgi:hypothetical protein